MTALIPIMYSMREIVPLQFGLAVAEHTSVRFSALDVKGPLGPPWQTPRLPSVSGLGRPGKKVYNGCGRWTCFIAQQQCTCHLH